MIASPRFIVKVSRARMPSSCKGSYVRVGLLEVVPGTKPKMISSRARGVISVIRTWERRFDGRTERCASARAVTAARKLAAELEAEYAASQPLVA